MDIAALLFACSVHPDDSLLLSMAYVYGRGDPYVVVDGSSTSGPDDALEHDAAAPRSPAAARLIVDRILSGGGEPVVGLLPVRPQWASEFGKTLADLFDPCTAVAVASAKLSEFDDACRGHGAPRQTLRRACALDRYSRSVGLVALGRAVLADMTLPAPFASDAELDPLPSGFQTLPMASELFFPTAPLQPSRWTPTTEPLP